MPNFLANVGWVVTAGAAVVLCIQFPIVILFIVLTLGLLHWLNPKV